MLRLSCRRRARRFPFCGTALSRASGRWRRPIGLITTTPLAGGNGKLALTRLGALVAVRFAGTFTEDGVVELLTTIASCGEVFVVGARVEVVVASVKLDALLSELVASVFTDVVVVFSVVVLEVV